MQSKKILLSSILCSSIVASYAFADNNATSANEPNSADGGGAFN